MGTRRGILFVISAPSGAGKSTLARALREAVPGLGFSVSYTTRPRREGEVDGREYHFVDEEAFRRMVADGRFLEWAKVHDRHYGTAREAIEAALAGGEDLLLDIDVQGAAQLRDTGCEAVFVFVLPPDFETLAARLTGRRSEAVDERRHRLAVARREADAYRRYDYVVVNDDLGSTVAALASIVTSERLRVARQASQAEQILATFADD